VTNFNSAAASILRSDTLEFGALKISASATATSPPHTLTRLAMTVCDILPFLTPFLLTEYIETAQHDHPVVPIAAHSLVSSSFCSINNTSVSSSTKDPPRSIYSLQLDTPPISSDTQPDTICTRYRDVSQTHRTQPGPICPQDTHVERSFYHVF
jgi:hypothetical protein